MAKKHFFTFPLSLKETLDVVRKEAENERIYCWNNNNTLVIRIPYLMGGLLPVNFQISFVAKLRYYENRTVISGKFDAPKAFYTVYYCAFFVVAIAFIFLSYRTHGSSYYLLFNVSLLVFANYVLIKTYIYLSKWLFRKQNRELLEFLDRIANRH